MSRLTTLDRAYWPLMELPSVELPFCAVCGRNRPLERHHFVWRGWGEFYRGGVLVAKPTVTLCGFGNNLRDADGIPYCHGRAHWRMLHFRNGGGRLEFLETEEPTAYAAAMEMGGWRPVLDEIGWYPA